jgi:hypothetical protein
LRKNQSLAAGQIGISVMRTKPISGRWLMSAQRFQNKLASVFGAELRDRKP